MGERKRPLFVVKSFECGSPRREDRCPVFDEDGVIYITLQNVGADISWLRLYSHSSEVISFESKTMPHGAIVLLKMNLARLELRRRDGAMSAPVVSHAVIEFEYSMADGYNAVQTFHYGNPTLYSLELQGDER